MWMLSAVKNTIQHILKSLTEELVFKPEMPDMASGQIL